MILLLEEYIFEQIAHQIKNRIRVKNLKIKLYDFRNSTK